MEPRVDAVSRPGIVLGDDSDKERRLDVRRWTNEIEVLARHRSEHEDPRDNFHGRSSSRASASSTREMGPLPNPQSSASACRNAGTNNPTSSHRGILLPPGT